MKSKAIRDCAATLAKEISNRKLVDLEETAILIEFLFNNCLVEFVKEYTSHGEKEYFDLLQQQSKNRPGSEAYVSMGYKLAAAKHKKASGNRILNEVRQESKYTYLKEFVVNKYGQEAFNQFVEEAEERGLFPATSVESKAIK